MNKRILAILLLLCSLLTKAQEVYVNADIVSSYMWRGMKCGSASIQPTLGVSLGGFTLSAWGSSQFSKGNNELDLSLEYGFKGFTLSFTDYFTQDEDESFDYFNYRARTTGHSYDAGIAYEFGERFPLSIAWYTMVAGNDFKENDKRAWSSYIELLYPFTVSNIDLGVEVGITPWEGLYANKFNVTNIALNASKSIKITDSFSFPLFGKLGFNPYENHAYFVVGIGF